LRNAAPEPEGPGILYLTPTRALANDLQKRLSPPLEQLGLRLGLRHGEHNDLARIHKPHLLVTTPESLDVMLMSREPALSTVRAVLLDEAHLLYNSQRGFQAGILLSRLEQVAGSLQVAGLSATVASPEAIWAFLRPGHEAKVVLDDSGRELDFVLRSVAGRTDLAPLLDRLDDLPNAKVLVFVNSRRECDALGAAIAGRTHFGPRVFVHHSSLSKEQRLATESQFSEAGRAICIATSTLELGIDIGDIDVVFLYGHPGGWESFLQRIGRGNRRSNTSNVVAIASAEHGSVPYAIFAFQALVYQIRTGQVEREEPITLFGAGLQQLLSHVLARHGSYCRLRDLSALFANRSGYTDAVVEEMVDHLVESGYLRRHGYLNRVGPTERLHRLKDLRLIWGNFPVRSREITVHSGGRNLGGVPAVNAVRMARGDVFIFGGGHWRVVRIRPDRIEVDRTTAPPTVGLTFGGGKRGLDPHNVNGILDYICSGTEPEGLNGQDLLGFCRELEGLRSFVTKEVIPVSRDGAGGHTYFTFGGRLLNEVIGRWSGVDFRAGDVFLETNRSVDWSALPADLTQLATLAAQAMGVPAELTLFQTLLPERLLTAELSQLWVASNSFRRTLDRLRRARPLVCDAPSLNSILA
jgi:ATP-dependent Lhr-like helicase